ncbi:hypothetical protein VST63_21975 [Mycolicibacterium sp. 050232]|uniref:hypothetical protein n=1 Tax=Mycolicibacterium sp. 050232 TaxID=3113982 RepID=UPI002E291653|nr:hypothetical protein [Mycolicibacterium sp. 050232]MED5815037.1 hypothetical protein [Mycolicibacterium sp. 050232]
MNSRVASGLTACVAAATAGVIAITPVTTPTPTRLVDASSTLMASFGDMNQAELAAEFGKRFVEQVAQAPLLPLILAAQLAANDGNVRLFSQIRQIVDSPVYVADPLIEAIADTVPEALGGGSNGSPNNNIPGGADGDGAIMQFRNNELLGLRDDINAQFADALGVNTSWPNENYAAELAEGLLKSAENTVTGTALGAVGLVAVAQAMASGDNLAVYKAVKEYIDAPMWAIDPAIEGIADALPEELGGGTNHVKETSESTGPGVSDDGTIMQFRNKQLIGARDQVRLAAANILNVRDKVDSTGNVLSDDDNDNSLNRTQSLSATNDDNGGSKVNNLKPHVTSLNTALNDAKDKAKERRAKAKANVDNVVKKVKEAAGSTAKKLGAKKSSSED